MKNNIIIKKITIENIDKLKYFFDNCGNSKIFFTYFNKRDYDYIKNHVYTCLAFLDDDIVGYAHLDNYIDNIWFGICVSEKHCGKKIGNMLLENVIQEAIKININKISLSVYKNNLRAYSLYVKYGFKTIKETEQSFFMEKEI